MDILTEKYRPKTVSELIIPDSTGYNLCDKIIKWKEQGCLDEHLLLFGPAGTGKSSTVKVILNELDVQDFIIINGSDKTSIDDMRKVIEYASVTPVIGKMKVVVIEEFERLSQQAQDSLKYIMEVTSGWCRFILTTNNISKVSMPIISRCETYNYKELNKVQFIQKIITVLDNENISYTTDNLTSFIDAYYPDVRSCIIAIQQHTSNTNNGKQLNKAVSRTSNNSVTYKDIVELGINGQEIRNILVDKFSDEDYDEIYRYMYSNIESITEDVSKYGDIFIKIAEYLYKNQTVAFKDINLTACLFEIYKILKGC